MFDTIREILSDHARYKSQIWGLARTDLKKAYTGTTLGWAWALANPIVRIAVYVFAFSIGLKQNEPVGEFAYFYWFLAGIVVWFYVQKVFGGGAACIKKYRFLVTKIKFPISLIPTFTCLSKLLVHFVLLGGVLVIFMIGGHWPTLYWLQLPFYTLMLFLFFQSWGLFAGILSTMNKDFYEFVRSISMALFWLSGIFFKIDSLSLKWRAILYINPVAVAVKGYRDCLIYGNWFWHNPWVLEGIAGYIVITVLALLMYKKFGKELPDVL